MTKIGFIGNSDVQRPESTDNTGNIVHGHAARSLFAEYRSVSSEPSDANVAALRGSITHLCFVAATMLHTRRQPAYVASHERAAQFVEKLDLPVCTFGFGSQAELGETVADAQVDPRSIRLLRAIADRADTVGVRGAFTADLCAKYGIRNVTVVGCQSAHVAGLLNTANRTLSPRGIRAVGNLSIGPDERHVQRILMESGADTIGQNNEVEHLIATRALSREDFVADTGGHWLFPSILRMFDEGMITRGAYYDYIAGHFHKFYNVEDWRKHIRWNYDFGFGTRFHGNMIAFQAGVPALWLVHDMRTRELCDHLNLPAIPQTDVGPRTTLDELKARCDYGPFWAALPQRAAEFLSYLERNGVAPALKREVRAGLTAIAAGGGAAGGGVAGGGVAGGGAA